jgi:hypothetical protein
MDIQLGDVGHIIQLAIAPVFLLTGVGTNLMVLTNRLARIIDRSRVLEGRLAEERTDHSSDLMELETLYRRSHLINRAIALSASSALLVCIVIGALFIGDALNFELGKFIASLFVLTMLAFIGSLIFLLREIFVATSTMSMHRASNFGKRK